MFIKENQKIIGMLCINFDDSKFHDINCQILRIIHPDMFVKNYLSDVSYNILVDENKSQNDEENSTDNIEAFMEKIFQEVNLKFNYPLERLTKHEREKIIQAPLRPTPSSCARGKASSMWCWPCITTRG